MIGLDTSTIIDLFKGNEKVKLVLEKNKEPLVISISSYLELFFGIDAMNSKHNIEASYYRELFSRVYVLNLTQNACEEASNIFWKLKREGREIDQFDCVIASIFLTNGINKIITGNVKHFERIKDLEVIRY